MISGLLPPLGGLAGPNMWSSLLSKQDFKKRKKEKTKKTGDHLGFLGYLWALSYDLGWVVDHLWATEPELNTCDCRGRGAQWGLGCLEPAVPAVLQARKS